ncbi:hypothetical protein PASE110613_03420 [Paenibacillus sediminis]|uniref:Deoxycytidylate deaminase n=1 Tax=Paenibacillus sediminis TaxID=664909 RepID=A0ABS4GYR2_9BACL|nr:hypothetical protein [Paenibacillus sediminis]MBP1935361.1 deoxycytidylate deaminase [Paenibacillus sediminis]
MTKELVQASDDYRERLTTWRGSVLVQGKKLLGTAYNGAPMGLPDCSEAGCMIAEEVELVNVDGQEQMVKKQRCIRTIHAEQNLLLFTDRIDREGSVVYVTDEPCWTCANMLAKRLRRFRTNFKIYGEEPHFANICLRNGVLFVLSAQN